MSVIFEIFRWYETHPLTGNRNAEIAFENFVKSQITN